MGKLQVERKMAGIVSTNCYLIINKESRQCVIVDPADNKELLIRWIGNLEVQPTAILLTHGHFDHCGAAEALSERYGIPIYAGEQEEIMLNSSEINLSQQFVEPFTVKAQHYMKDREELELAGFHIQVWHTPGHTQGSVCFYLPEENVIFSGDTLFCESVGRTDFPTGSMSALMQSVKYLLKELPETTLVYPGHNEETTIAHEKEYNPFR